ncbi:MAG: regulatory protein RecX [Spirochaetaceae bacterium]|nr:regulatory protein RecX [Spirochaetaceae bacterium]
MQISDYSSFETDSKDSETVYMFIDSIEEVSGGCLKVIPSKGPSFFIRLDYVDNELQSKINPYQSLNENETELLLAAGYAFLSERDALNYLNRSEHSRFLLTQKLQKKGHGIEAINCSLDFLEQKNYLSDRRYAISWLRNRRISKSEGRKKLFQHLLARGISKSIAEDALDEFYDEFSEFAMLEKAYSKCLKQNLPEDKIDKKLLLWGFSFSMIKEVKNSYLKN